MNETCLLHRASSQFLYNRLSPQPGVKQSDPGVLSHGRRIFWLNLYEYCFISGLQRELIIHLTLHTRQLSSYPGLPLLVETCCDACV